MELINTYLINRNGKQIWLGINSIPESSDITIEIRPVLVSDFKNNKVLQNKTTNEISESVWIKPQDSIDNYIEIDRPKEEDK